jgi:hypothetical protein
LLSATNLAASDPLWEGAIYGGTPTYTGAIPLWFQNWFNATYPDNWYYAQGFAAHPASPVPIYGPHGFNYQQDGFDWLAKGYVDIVMPMQYTMTDSLWNAEVDIWNTFGTAAGYDPHKVIQGMGWLTQAGQADWGLSFSSISSHINYGRSNGVKGFSVFLLDSFDDSPLYTGLSGSSYAAPAPSWMANYSDYHDFVGSANSLPVVNAGDDQTITLPATATLTAEAVDIDASPSPLTYSWSKSYGPGTVTFGSGTNTTATFSEAGTYIIQFSANDGLATTADTLTVTVAPSSNTSITSFNFASPATTGTIDNTAHTVVLTVPYNTVVTSLTPTIVLAAGATIAPLSGSVQNFSSPVHYIVTAQDGATTQEYIVSVTVAPSTAKAITGFTIPNQVGDTTIDQTAYTVALTMPYGTAVIALIPTITQTGSSISPASGVAQSFASPATYTVTAANASTQPYTVTITIAAAPTPTPVVSTSHSGGTSVSSQIQNLIAMGNTQMAEKLKQQYPSLYPAEIKPVVNNANKIPASIEMTEKTTISFLTRSWSFGQRENEVKQLQQFLNTHGFSVAQSGPGSKGKETTMFVYATKAAVIRFQKANKISPIGIVGPQTRKAIEELFSKTR